MTGFPPCGQDARRSSAREVENRRDAALTSGALIALTRRDTLMPSARKGSHMRHALILTLAIVLLSTAASAQERRGYVEGTAGLTAVTGGTTGNANGELGIRVLPRVVLFGNIGRMRDAESSSLQTSLNDTVTALAANDLAVTGTVRVPAWYSLGGARIDLTNRSAITPYVFGGIGFAKLSPSARFLYQSGPTLTGSDALTGDDITSDVEASGLFAAPSAQTGLMLRTGGGVQVPLGKYLLGNVGYSVSRISATTPIHTQDLTFGVGFRF
jgi:opacity protein-like surface antigen